MLLRKAAILENYNSLFSITEGVPIMSYYIKISYHNKMKKFIVRNPKQINIQQIKNTFNPPIASSLGLSFVVKYKS